LIWFLFAGVIVSAQKINGGYQLLIQKTSTPIKIDGQEDDEHWLKADVAKDFFLVLPMDTSFAKVKTEVKMAYDDHHLYLIAICHTLPGPYMVESLRRDFTFVKNDNFLLFMDPFDDQTNGFSFGANAAGAQWDGIMYEGGKVDLSWDNKWISKVVNYDDRWVFEASIPFKSIRYKKGIKQWGINFSRQDLKTTEKSSWAPVPRQFPTASLAYTGILNWEEPPPSVGSNISLIPYALTGGSKNYLKDTPISYRNRIGADAKIAVTSSLNLDLTINPDFSQVDVDRQVTNLQRFELFFPERRQFFLENGDLFANFGYATIRPFFSRRIGLTTPIKFGARLSGKINRNWRIGAMNMQTQSVDSIALPEQNFTVVSVQRRLFARSNIGIIAINKQSLNYTAPVDPNIPVYKSYNRNLGIEYNLASSNNIWTGKLMALKSFSPSIKGHDFTQAGHLTYFTRKLNLTWQHEYVGKNFVAEVGYVPRTGYVRAFPQASYLMFPSRSVVLSHGPIFNSSVFYTDHFKRTDNESYATYKITFRTLSTLQAWAGKSYVKLLKGFDPTNSHMDTLARGTRHYWKTIGMDYVSKQQQLFTSAISWKYGGYYANGTLFTFTSEFGYRIQPYVSIILSSSYNDLRLPAPWNNTRFWLISPRLDVTLTNKLFFTAFGQYNQQQKNVNLNTRIQWRYKPASDLFIVYTDNYLPENFAVKTRALVIKLNYWLSI
jgi:hypothetical protein